MSDNDSDEDNDDDQVSDQEKGWEELYHSTFNDCVRMTKYGNKVTTKFKAAQEEISSLKNELEHSIENVHLFESKKNRIAEKSTTQSQKLEQAKQEIKNLKIELQIVKTERKD